MSVITVRLDENNSKQLELRSVKKGDKKRMINEALRQYFARAEKIPDEVLEWLESSKPVTLPLKG